jgi:hypothetical protein
LARRIPLPADPAELRQPVDLAHFAAPGGHWPGNFPCRRGIRCIVVAAAACFAQAKLASRVTE